jgi:DNA-binding response OmpR family regulator
MFKRILLIDDSENDALLLKRALFRAGFEDPVFHIDDPDVACDYLAGEGKYSNREKYPIPEVVFLDLKMPKFDGFQILKWIKGQPQLGRVIVIVLTHMQDVRMIQLAYQLGAHSFLSKGADPEEVQNVVKFLRDYSRISSTLPKPPKSNGNSHAA